MHFDKPLAFCLAHNCTSLASLTSYSWATIEDDNQQYKIIIHGSFNNALNYLHEADNFCYGIVQTEALRKIIPTLDDFLDLTEEELDDNTAILLG